jgi:hypothetical protein
LEALVPRPRLHLIRFHGVLAPNAKLRSLVVPQGPEQPKRAVEAAAAECEVEHAQARPHRISRARLLKRAFGIDMQHCRRATGPAQVRARVRSIDGRLVSRTRRPAQ